MTEVGQEIPSFQKKTTIPVIAHNDFLAPTGDGGNLILSTIVESLEEVKEMEGSGAMTLMASAMSALALYALY